MDRAGSGTMLAGLGFLLPFLSVATGSLSTGSGIEVPAVLLRVGVAYVVLGVATVSVRSMSIPYAVLIGTIALSTILVVGAAVMYLDLVLTPPRYGTPVTARRLVARQVEIALGLAPVPAGYVAGVFDRRGRSFAAVGTLVATAIVGWTGATWMMLARGSALGFTQLLVLLLVVGAIGFGLIPLLLLRSHQ